MTNYQDLPERKNLLANLQNATSGEEQKVYIQELRTWTKNHPEDTEAISMLSKFESSTEGISSTS